MLSLQVSTVQISGEPTAVALEIHDPSEVYEFATMLRELAKESMTGDFFADSLCELQAAERLIAAIDKIPKWNNKEKKNERD